MMRRNRRGVAALLVLLSMSFTAASAQQGEDTPPETKASKADKDRAREERIQEYLRKKEERRLRRDTERAAAEAAAAEAAPAAATTTAAATTGKTRKGSALPRDVQKIHDALREAPLGQDPTVIAYLDLIEDGEATAQQLAAFGTFLGEAGMTRAAIAYYGLALDLERGDTLLWLNVGTLHRQIREFDAAVSAYSQALSIDISNSYAHYNLGAVFDQQGKYEDAIEEYRMALTIDPDLGDPAFNPQSANNPRLLAVRLLIYQEQVGNLGLPLVKIPGGELADSTDQP